jgi:hypothetical protein
MCASFIIFIHIPVGAGTRGTHLCASLLKRIDCTEHGFLDVGGRRELWKDTWWKDIF